MLDGVTTSANAESPSSSNSISAVKLLQNVESFKYSGKKLLDFSKIVDGNGEPCHHALVPRPCRGGAGVGSVISPSCKYAIKGAKTVDCDIK